MNPQSYNYMALFRAVCLLVFVAGLVILALNHRAQIRARLRRVRAWWRHQQGHVLPVLFLFATAGIGWLCVWVRWILTHEVR